jgi:rRNA maturation protein Nop10
MLIYTTTICRCGSRTFVVTDERFDLDDEIVTGVQTCPACGTRYIYARRPTRAEQAAQAVLVSSDVSAAN